jgi:hypothetical protein
MRAGRKFIGKDGHGHTDQCITERLVAPVGNTDRENFGYETKINSFDLSVNSVSTGVYRRNTVAVQTALRDLFQQIICIKSIIFL